MKKHLLPLIIGMSTCFQIQAANVFWIAGSGNWNVATNWSTGALPTAADDVFIYDNGITVTIPLGYTASADRIELGSNLGFEPTLNIFGVGNFTQFLNFGTCEVMSGGLLELQGNQSTVFYNYQWFVMNLSSDILS